MIMESRRGNKKALEAIVARSAVDWELRQQLLTDPHAAIRRVFGMVIPLSFRIKFIERDPDLDALVVLPEYKPNGPELSDKDLESVTGGVEEGVLWSDAMSENGDGS